MKKRRIQIRPGTSIVLALAVGAACAWLASVSALQAPPPIQRRPPAAAGYRAPRAADGHADLNGIWFGLETDIIPPSYIYIELNDRKTNTKYKSNLAETTL